MSLAEAIASLRDWIPSAPSPVMRTVPPKTSPHREGHSEQAAGCDGQTGVENGGLVLEYEAQPDLEDIAEFLAERSAIMEFDGGLDRTEAQSAAGQLAAVKYQLAWLCAPPQASGGYAMRGEWDSIEGKSRQLQELQERHSSR